MVTAKLHINISQGIIDVEGDPELVRAVYEDFKIQLLAGPTVRSPLHQDFDETANAPENGKSKAKVKRKPSSKKRAASDDVGPNISADSPKLDKSLDTSTLVDFYERYETTNNPEKILVFLKFLKDELGIDNPNTDQVYTCFEKVNARVPKAFSQAFRDTSGRKFGYIDYNSATDINVTTVGNNHFKFDLKKKAAE